MSFNVGKIYTTISLKNIITIRPLNLFLFSVRRIKVGERWGRFMIIYADGLIQKFWWI
jgi:hypothetical protein